MYVSMTFSGKFEVATNKRENYSYLAAKYEVATNGRVYQYYYSVLCFN